MDSFASLQAINYRIGTIAMMLELAEGRGLETVDQVTYFSRVLLRAACDFPVETDLP